MTLQITQWVKEKNREDYIEVSGNKLFRTAARRRARVEEMQRKCRGRHGQESVLESNIEASNSLRGEWPGGRISCSWATCWHGLLANPDPPGMEVIRNQRLGLVALPVWRGAVVVHHFAVENKSPGFCIPSTFWKKKRSELLVLKAQPHFGFTSHLWFLIGNLRKDRFLHVC